MTALPVLLAALVAAQGQAAPPAQPAPAPVPAPAVATPAAVASAAMVARRVEGKVAFATATAAYLDAGAREGLAAGQVVRLARNGQPSGSCTVRETGDHFASCEGSGIRAGDRFAVETAVPAAPPVAELAPIPTDEELARRNAVVVATPVAMVEAKVAPRPVTLSQLPVLRGDLGYVLWYASSGSPGQNAQRIQVDLQVNGLDTFAGFRLFADARFLQWTEKNPTNVPGSYTQLQVYDLELAQRDPSRGWSAAFGRVQPWFVPGSSVFDGAQAGLRLGRNEVGVFGGLVPDPWTTTPTVDNYTGGLYGNFEVPLDRYLLTGAARAAIVQNGGVGRHYEGEVTLNFWTGGLFGANGNLRMGFGDLRAPAFVDAARIYASLRPIDIVNISAGFSYWGLDIPNSEPMATYPGPSRRADGFASVDATDWLRIAVLGGWVSDIVSGLDHEYVGPEVMFPRVLNGLSFGYVKDLGWVDGQSAWGQIQWSPTPATRLYGRLSWWQTPVTIGGTPSSTDSNELGLTVNATVGILDWLSLRASVMLRAAIEGGEGVPPWGTVSSVYVVGAY
jgi:hypothetical protein